VGGTAGQFVKAFRGPLVAFAVVAAPAFWLLRSLPQGGSLPAVVMAIVAVSVFFMLIWLAADSGLRGDLSQWRRGPLETAPDRNGGRP
jgi:hypothetical protein